jgi:hypothetical protein
MSTVEQGLSWVIVSVGVLALSDVFMVYPQPELLDISVAELVVIGCFSWGILLIVRGVVRAARSRLSQRSQSRTAYARPERTEGRGISVWRVALVLFVCGFGGLVLHELVVQFAPRALTPSESDCLDFELIVSAGMCVLAAVMVVAGSHFAVVRGRK